MRSSLNTITCLLGLTILMAIEPISLFGESDPVVESTMLMFVGENIDVLSIASKREESAWQAPAIVDIISREDLTERGSATLSQALSMSPGFYMAPKEWGTLPYLRGIPNSILFLYDTVPLNADTSKSLQQLDQQLSLGPVKRIEVVRGPGSVLWGPDAFAGIVNIVPLTGKDIDGIETAVSYNAPWEQTGFTMNIGRNADPWDAILSINGKKGDADDNRRVNLIRFWKSEAEIFPPEDRMGENSLSEARYLDVYGRLAWKDRLHISGRIADNRTPYSIARSEEDLIWPEAREMPGGFVKLETKNEIDRSSALRYTGYYSQYQPSTTVIDRTFEQRERTVYSELIFDKRFDSGSSLFSSGISFRDRRVDDANIWVSYLPDFLGPDNEAFTPQLIQDDYSSRLWSFFSQYSHKIGPIDLSAGIRFDQHDIYADNVSYSFAGVYPYSSEWNFKCVMGTAYRTPYASQLIQDETPELEKIRSLSVQAAWGPSKRVEMALTGFYNRIESHIQEDPYAGLSQPNHQDIFGGELQGKWRVTETTDLAANLTVMDNSGPKERYHFLSSVFIRPDGTIEEIYEDYYYDFDTGPRCILNLMGTWRPGKDMSLFVRGAYAASQELIYPRGADGRSYPGHWMTEATLRVKNVISDGWEMGISFRNLFDSDNKVPGVYSGIEVSPFEAEMVLQRRW